MLEYESLFRYDEVAPRVFERNPEAIIQVSFEISMDLERIRRSGYTVLDMFSELGGLSTVIYGAFRLLVYSLNFNNFASHLASNFYELKDSKAGKRKSIPLIPSRTSNLKEFCVEKLFKKVCICRRCRIGRMQRGMIKARQALFQEVSILEMIKLQRFLKLAMSNILPCNTVNDLRKRVRTRVIELESDTHEAIEISSDPM